MRTTPELICCLITYSNMIGDPRKQAFEHFLASTELDIFADAANRLTRLQKDNIDYSTRNVALKFALRGLVEAVERAGDWSDETRVGMALKRAEAVLNLQDPVEKNG